VILRRNIRFLSEDCRVAEQKTNISPQAIVILAQKSNFAILVKVGTTCKQIEGGVIMSDPKNYQIQYGK